MSQNEELDLHAIEQRLLRATPGPWRFYRKSDLPLRVDDGQGYDKKGSHLISLDWPNNDAIIFKDADGEFIANAPTDIAALIEEVRRLRDIIDEKQEEIAKLDGSYYDQIERFERAASEIEEE